MTHSCANVGRLLVIQAHRENTRRRSRILYKRSSLQGSNRSMHLRKKGVAAKMLTKIRQPHRTSKRVGGVYAKHTRDSLRRRQDSWSQRHQWPKNANTTGQQEPRSNPFIETAYLLFDLSGLRREHSCRPRMAYVTYGTTET